MLLDDELLGPAQIPLYHDIKTCRRCGGKLELSRYYACTTCLPKLPDDIDGEMEDLVLHHVKRRKMSNLPQHITYWKERYVVRINRGPKETYLGRHKTLEDALKTLNDWKTKVGFNG